MRFSTVDPKFRDLMNDLLISPVELRNFLILAIGQLFGFLLDEGNEPFLKLQYFILEVPIILLYY